MPSSLVILSPREPAIVDLIEQTSAYISDPFVWIKGVVFPQSYVVVSL
jgi:hypothetical protein